MKLNPVIQKAHITEKSIKETQINHYTFNVSIEATKPQIKKSVEELFKVNVLSVKTVIHKGKTRKTGRRRTAVQLSDRKKAIVWLKKDQKIDLFDKGGQT